MPRPLLIMSQSNSLILIVDIQSHSKWQIVQIQISWLLKKPTDLDLHCLQRQDISRFSSTRVNQKINLGGRQTPDARPPGHPCPKSALSRAMNFEWCNCLVSGGGGSPQHGNYENIDQPLPPNSTTGYPDSHPSQPDRQPTYEEKQPMHW